MANDGRAKTGLQLDWVRAMPVCSEVADCPALPGATHTECSSEGRCVYDAPDDDGDRICNAIDLCSGADDLDDADRDRFPDACECDASNAAVNPRENDVCDSLDNDCNGISAPTQPVGERYVSMEKQGREHPQHYAVEASDESMFGRLLRVNASPGHLTWLYVGGAPSLWLQPGRYVADWRVAPGSGGSDPTTLLVRPGDSNRPCVTPASVSWSSPTADGTWQTTVPVAFEVTTPDCPVRAGFLNTQGSKDSTWMLDWVRVRHACDADADCPSIGSSGAACVAGACS